MSIENMISWMTSKEGRITYSMTNRLGPNSYDCSSAVFFSLIAGGYLPKGSMGNTETLFAMNGTFFKKISRAEVRRGDIFIAGTPGASHGSEGHTGKATRVLFIAAITGTEFTQTATILT